MDIWVVCTFWLLWIMLLYTSVYKCLCDYISFQFFLGTEEWNSYMTTLCLKFWGTFKLFPKVTASFYIPTRIVWVFHFLHSLTNTRVCPFGFSHSDEYEVVSHNFHLHFPTKNVEHLFKCLLVINIPFQRNVYTNPLLMFSISCLFT